MRLVREKRGKRSAPPSTPPATRAVELCLSIGPTGVGLGLARPARLGPVWVRELEVALPGLAFPLDVSGGVHRFRHRRGELRRLRIGASLAELTAWATPALRDLVDAGVPIVRLTPSGSTSVRVEIATADGPHPPRVLVFEVACRIEDDDLELVAGGARGANLTAPPAKLAGEALGRVLGRDFTRCGSLFALPKLAARVASTLLPEAGARAPRPSPVGPSDLGLAVDGFELSLRSGRGFVGDEASLRAAEGARLAEAADTHVASGDLEAGRAALLEALARAPRHPELTARLIAIDALADDRGEAALASLREVERDTALLFGDLPSALVERGGDRAAAHARAVRDAEREPAATLRAALRLRAAALEPGTLASLSHLDEAACDAPDRAYIRRARLTCGLAAGRLEDADADAGFLEAMARGPVAKCRALVDVGAAFAAAGHEARAAAYFERALRFAPDDPRALAGLGASLAAAGRAARGATLLARAVKVSSSAVAAAPAGLALARLLESPLGDLPAAAARAAEIPSGAAEAPEARLVEGRVRARLEDHAGARLALARLREEPLRACPEHIALLVEAIRIERDVLHDPGAALRTASFALSLRGLDPDLLALRDALERETDARATVAVGETRSPTDPRGHDEESFRLGDDETIDEPRAELARPRTTLDEAFGEATEEDDALAARVEPLVEKLRADPTRDDVVDELVELLTKLGRGLELLALLSARLDDAPEARRPELVGHQRDVLIRLEREAREAGRAEEASLFAMSREMLG